MSDIIDDFEEFTQKTTPWDWFRIGLSIIIFFYAVVATVFMWTTVLEPTYILGLTGTVIGSLGFGFGIISSIQNGIQLREIKQQITHHKQ